MATMRSGSSGASSSSSVSASSLLVVSTAAAALAGVAAAAALYELRAVRRANAEMASAAAAKKKEEEGKERESSCGTSSSTTEEEGNDDDGPRSSRPLRRSDSVTVTLPSWASSSPYYDRTYRTDDEMMDVAVRLSARNVAEGTGGPFGSAIFARNLATGEATLVSVGVNRVVPLGNSTLHGETVAIQMAQSEIGSYSLRGSNDNARREEKKDDIDADAAAAEGVRYELFTSCEPCAMCLGATLWSGVGRMVCAARKEDAAAIGFDEGPVYESSYEHLRQAGVEVVRGVRTEEAAEVLREYGRTGVIYNG